LPWRPLSSRSRNVVSQTIGSQTSFTQVCGYPLFKHYRDRFRMLATPHYAMAGCVGATHRAFFMVRANDSARHLNDLRGQVFGCNSLLSNSGMNLPRLSLARIAGGKPFFSSVVMTGAHDVCAVDNVTWGFFRQFRPLAATRYRVLEETVSSPSLPFVTLTSTAAADAIALAETLHDIMRDPQLAHLRDILQLTGLSVPDIAAYERLADYEREAAKLGYPELL
jgi:ABC-type phosphate/phosphonate transport system substrate-binding protein